MKVTAAIGRAAPAGTNDAALSAIGPAEYVHQFGDLAALIARVAGRDRALNAMRDMITQNLLLDPAQCGADGRNLRHDVDAVTVVLNHAGKSARLPLDALEPVED